MQIKKILSIDEKTIFKANMDLSRAQRKGGGFHETDKSRLGEIHLKYGELWALFDDNNKMIAGAVLHDLATLPPSFFKPDLSQYPPDKVIEGSELWSLSPNAALMFQKGMMIILQKRDINCFYCYVPMTPIDLRPFYAGFEPLAEPFIWPWVVTNEGEYTWCQPLGLKEASLAKVMESMKGTYKFDGNILHLDSKFMDVQEKEDINALKKDLREIISNKLKIKPESLKDDESLADRGIDSLIAVELMEEIEKKLSIELPVEFFFENLTLNDAANSIASQLQSLKTGS